MAVEALSELCTALAIKYHKSLDSVGDLPYELVQAILSKVGTAQQLHLIESNSPQIQGHIEDLWIKIIERDFPLELKGIAYKPSRPDQWYTVWKQYKKDHDLGVQQSEDRLKNALAGARQDKANNTSRIVEQNSLPKSLQAAAAKKPRSRNSSGSRTKNTSGNNFMRKARREAEKTAAIHNTFSGIIRAPTRRAVRDNTGPAPDVTAAEIERPPLRQLSPAETHAQRYGCVTLEADDDNGADDKALSLARERNKPVLTRASSSSSPSAGPSSPPAAPVINVRKRKAVEHFIRPKRRA